MLEAGRLVGGLLSTAELGEKEIIVKRIANTVEEDN